MVDILFGYFAYLHSLYTVVELHTNFVLIHFGRQPIFQPKVKAGSSTNFWNIFGSEKFLVYWVISAKWFTHFRNFVRKISAAIFNSVGNSMHRTNTVLRKTTPNHYVAAVFNCLFSKTNMKLFAFGAFLAESLPNKLILVLSVHKTLRIDPSGSIWMNSGEGLPCL